MALPFHSSFYTRIILIVALVCFQYFIGFSYIAHIMDKNAVVDRSGESGDKFICLIGFTCVYSAYFDNITETIPKIRIVGIDDPMMPRNSVHCSYYDKDGKLMDSSLPAKKIISGYGLLHKHPQSLAFFLCDMKKVVRKGPGPLIMPTYVWLNLSQGGNTDTTTGLLPSSSETTKQQMLQIHYHPNHYKFKVAACVQPFHSGFYDALLLLEWIEYHRLLGVEHFTFYNFNGGPTTIKLLETYGPQIVTILNWNLPMGIIHTLKNFGQYEAASDCAHRHRGVAQYVTTFDTDEFFVLPPSYKNLYQFLQHTWRKYEAKWNMTVSSVIFLAKFSFSTWTSNKSIVPRVPSIEKYYIGLDWLLEKLLIPSRHKFISGVQKKFVYKPELIQESGVHWAEVPVHGTTMVHFPVNFAYYIHFKDCTGYFSAPNALLPNKATCNRNQVEGVKTDRYPALTYGSRLAEAVAKKITSSEETMCLFNVSRKRSLNLLGDS